MKKKVAVIIRVFSRIEDALGLIHIIRTQWKSHEYTLFVTHNGKESGFVFPENSLDDVNLIEVKENSGHRTGAKDLLLASFDYLDADFDFIAFIESDFWLLNEGLMLEAIEANKDIASTIWVESRKSIAVDFFVVKPDFILKHKALFDWDVRSPETSFGQYLREHKAEMYIFQTLRPIHAPSSMRGSLKFLPFGSSYEGGRFRLFEEAKVLSHHVEELEKGIRTKRTLANKLAQKEIFSVEKVDTSYKLALFEKNIQKIARFFPQSAWFKKSYWQSLKK